MLKYCETGIVFREFPDEVTLAINLSNCPHRCPGCHSPHLQTDCGSELTDSELERLVEKYEKSITCVGFMGGDGDVVTLVSLMAFVRIKFPRLKIGWYTGYSDLKKSIDLSTLQWIENCLDYVKTGPYVEELGGLDSPTTNQTMHRKKEDGTWETVPMHR